jgi:hypothetical protein
MLGGWIATAVLFLAWPYPLSVGVALVVALGFTALFVAHMVAYAWRAVPRILRAMDEGAHPDPDMAGRRSAGAAIRMSWTALAMSLLGFGRIVLAGAGSVQSGRHETRKRTSMVPVRLRLEVLEVRVAPVSLAGDSDVLGITGKNGRPATEGVCPTCGTKIF